MTLTIELTPEQEARLRAHSLTRLLTFNAADFRRYPSITIVEPHQV